MKRLLPVLLLIALSSATNAQQDPVIKFTKSYFRSNPFNMTFGAFVEHVMRDPTLRAKSTHLRTDTSLFTFAGTYASFNPFGFKPSRVDVALVEQNVQLYEGRPQGDTIMLYVIIAYADSSAKGEADIKKEYERILRKGSRMFFDVKYEQLSDQDVSGGVANFFVNYAQLSPVTLEWITGLVKQPVLRLTLRIRSRGNEAVLPMSLYDSQ